MDADSAIAIVDCNNFYAACERDAHCTQITDSGGKPAFRTCECYYLEQLLLAPHDRDADSTQYQHGCDQQS